MMKGVKIERALPGNSLEIYGLFKQMVKEGVHPYPEPLPGQTENYHFQILELLRPTHPNEFFFIARRGLAVYGYIHASVMTRPFGRQAFCFINSLYVTKNKRKVGIGKGLINEVLTTMSKLGIASISAMVEDKDVAHYIKKYGAQKKLNLLVMER